MGHIIAIDGKYPVALPSLAVVDAASGQVAKERAPNEKVAAIFDPALKYIRHHRRSLTIPLPISYDSCQFLLQLTLLTARERIDHSMAAFEEVVNSLQQEDQALIAGAVNDLLFHIDDQQVANGG